MTRLPIFLLGPPEFELDELPVKGFASDKVRALLVYLAVEADRPHQRESLAGLFWSDWPDHFRFPFSRPPLYSHLLPRHYTNVPFPQQRQLPLPPVCMDSTAYRPVSDCGGQ